MGTAESGSSFKLGAEYTIVLDVFLFNKDGPT
jgi:hypothetical protein